VQIFLVTLLILKLVLRVRDHLTALGCRWRRYVLKRLELGLALVCDTPEIKVSHSLLLGRECRYFICVSLVNWLALIRKNLPVVWGCNRCRLRVGIWTEIVEDTLEIGTLLKLGDFMQVIAHVDGWKLGGKLLLNFGLCDLLRIGVDCWSERTFFHVYLQLFLLHLMQSLLFLNFSPLESINNIHSM